MRRQRRSGRGAVVRDAYQTRERVRRRRPREADCCSSPAIAIAAGGGDVVAGRRDHGPMDPPRARRAARRTGAVQAARIGERAGIGGGRYMDGRGGRVEPTAGTMAPGELVSARSVRGGRRGPMSSPRWIHTARFTGRSRDRPCTTRAGTAQRATAWRICRGTRCAWSPGTEPGITLLAAGVASIAPAWQPGSDYRLAYVTRSGHPGGPWRRQQAGTGPRHCQGRARELAWSSDGRELLAVSASRASLYDAAGHSIATMPASPGAPIRTGSLCPGRQDAGDDPRRRQPGRGGLEDRIRDDDAPAAARAVGSWAAAARVVARQPLAAGELARRRPVGVRPSRRNAADRRRLTHRAPVLCRGAQASAQDGFPSLEGWCCTALGDAG